MAIKQGLAGVTGAFSTFVTKRLAWLWRSWRGLAAPDDVMGELTALGFRGLQAPTAIGALAITAGNALAAHDHHDAILSVVSGALTMDTVLAMAVVAAFNRETGGRSLAARSALLWQFACGLLLWVFCAGVGAANIHFFLIRDQTGEYLSTLALFAIAAYTGGLTGFLPRIVAGGLAIIFGTLAVSFYASGLPRNLMMSGFALLSALIAARAEARKFAMVVDQLRLRRRFQDLAETDPLTGIANRRHFRARLDAACQRRDDLVLLMIDLDRFKAVNDTFGHETGDQLLLQVAARLRLLCRLEDVVARLGGDEFAVLQLGVRSEGANAAIAERIVSTLSAPYRIKGQSIEIGASVGWCLGRAKGHDPDAVVQHADAAMYRSKSHRPASQREDMLPEKGHRSPIV